MAVGKSKSSDKCILCLAPLLPDGRWRIIRALSPRYPVCRPATEECFRRLAARMGARPTNQQVHEAVQWANK